MGLERRFALKDDSLIKLLTQFNLTPTRSLWLVQKHRTLRAEAGNFSCLDARSRSFVPLARQDFIAVLEASSQPISCQLASSSLLETTAQLRAQILGEQDQDELIHQASINLNFGANLNPSHTAIKLSLFTINFKLDNHNCTLEIFPDFLSPLAILRVSFDLEQDGIFFHMPKQLSPFIKQELVGENPLTPLNLALFGYFEDFSLSKALNCVKNSLALPYAPSASKALTSLQVLLFWLGITLKFENLDDIKSAYEAILSSARLIKIFAGLDTNYQNQSEQARAIDPHIATHFAKSLEAMVEPLEAIINTSKVLNLAQKTKKPKKSDTKLILLLKSAIATQLANLSQQMSANAEFLREYELFLSDESAFFAAQKASQPAGAIAALGARSSALRLAKKLNALSVKSHNEEFISALKDAKSLNDIFKFYSHCFSTVLNKTKQDSLEKIIKLLNKLNQSQTALGVLVRAPEAPKHLRQKLTLKIQKLRVKILLLTRQASNEARMLNKILKIYKRQ